MKALRSTDAAVAEFYAGFKARAAQVETAYRDATPGSARLTDLASQVMPGGSTRDAVARRPYASFMASAEGGYLTDVDGRRLKDFWYNATSLPLGHGDSRVLAAVRSQLGKGISLFAPTEHAIELGLEICSRVPSADLVRFTNSGTEAVMLAVRLARGYTGRPLVAKFEGSYHGSYDDVSWSVSPAAGEAGLPDELGLKPVPATGGLTSATGRTLVLPYNDIAAVQQVLETHSSRLAAVIVEPMANRMGLIMPKPGFLEGLRRLCTEYGIVLIFDEVLSFRVAYHGTQGLLHVTPDLTTLGKIIGGGFAVGAVGGRADIMRVSEPLGGGTVTHTGTFNANPITMVAGKATLDALTDETFDRLNATGERLRTSLRRICSGLPLQVTGAGSLFKITATPVELESHRSTLETDFEWQEVVSLHLLTKGFFLTSQLQGCLSTATSDSDIEEFLDVFGNLLQAA